MKTREEIDSDIKSLVWNHGLEIQSHSIGPTDAQGYAALIDYIHKIEEEKNRYKREVKALETRLSDSFGYTEMQYPP